ncbi:MAG: potassium transporter KtrB [Clostridia bacterium]|nr:potassium transporter KtrB [Clostridia bacterium]
MKKRALKLSTTHIILLSFFCAIMLGTLLLALPMSSADGHSQGLVNALFTATTATCVTGLVVVPTVSAWSTFGQVVILLLIQLGGLGIITVMSGVALMFHRKMGLAGNMLLQDAFNLNTLSGLSSFVKKVIAGTFIIEGIGALLYMTVFVPDFGLRGIWISVFTAVSAFCNAGIDIIGTVSLCDYAVNPLINTVTGLLIVLGGIGYIVWWDFIRVITQYKKKKGNIFKRLTLHSKIALTATAVLLFGGAALFFVLEYNNSLTIGDMSLFDKIQICLFQSVTTRTAGFATVPQENLTEASAIVALLLMFIGGSPVGTAGGIKTVTITVLFAAAYAAIKNRNEVSMFSRTVSKQAVSKAIGVTCMSFTIMFVSTVLLATTTDAPALDILYETVSATATVGLTRNLTPSLNLIGRLIIIASMYLGRVGPISLAVAFTFKKQNDNIVKNPTEIISVG